MTSKKICTTNKEALRWCKSREALIEFDNWRKKLGFHSVPPGITCMVSISKLRKCERLGVSPWETIDKTLIKTVNKWIKRLTVKKK